MKHLQTTLLFTLLATTAGQVFAQRRIAFTNARIETASKSGLIEDGAILVKDGKIEAVGSDVEIPVTAHVIDLAGKTVIPGIVDPYFVVPISRSAQASTIRTVVFQGRTFIIGGGTPAVSTDFAKVADGFDASRVNWKPALRSGITSMHLVTAGYSQSMLGQLANDDDVDVTKADGLLHVTATNSTRSLDLLRNGLKGRSARGGSSRRPSPAQLAALRARLGGRTPSGGPPSRSQTSSQASSSPTAPLWSAVKDGRAPLFINVNNAASILHVTSILKDQQKARIALVASGQDTFLTIDDLGDDYTLILPPRIDLLPNSQDRINVPKLLNDKKINFCFSLSLGQSEFRAQQHNPLFPVAMLIRAGLNRQVAIEALTIGPAKLLGIEKSVGSLEIGKKANLIVVDGDPFAVTAGIDQVFIEGKPIHED